MLLAGRLDGKMTEHWQVAEWHPAGDARAVLRMNRKAKKEYVSVQKQ